MKSFLLIGIGRFGFHLATKLNELDHQIMAIDIEEENIEKVLPYVTNALIGDSTDEEFLSALGVDTFDVCIVTISNNFESSLITTLILKELGAKKIIARACRDVQEKLLYRNGADVVIYPEKQVANWTALRYSSDSVFDSFNIANGFAIFEVSVPEAWNGKTVGTLNIRHKYQMNILAVKTNNELNMYVTPDTILRKGQSLYVLGKSKDVLKCFKS